MSDKTHVRLDMLRATRKKVRQNIKEAQRSGDHSRLHTAYKISSFLAEALPYAWKVVGDEAPNSLPETDCPECRGRGGWMEERHQQVCGTIEDDETRAHFCHANCSKKNVACRVCGGSGELVGVARAVYMARGCAAPVQRRGHA